MLKTRHIILIDDGRSGSNFLVNTLNSHPEILNYNEVLGDWTRLYRLIGRRKMFFSDVRDYLDWAYSSIPLFYLAQAHSFFTNLKRGNLRRVKKYSQVKTIGIKEFLRNFRRKDCFDFLSDQKELHIIFLNRENILQKYVSLLYFRKSRVWATTSAAGNVPKITIDIDRMLRDISGMEERKEDFERFRDKYAGPRLTIRYSDYFKDEESMDGFNEKILEFLGVKHLKIQSRHKKILPRKLEDKIDNYDEVKRALTASNRKKYLNDAAI